MYCDMMPEIRNSPLLVNGPLTHVSGTSWNSPLLSNGSVSTFPWQRITQSNTRTVEMVIYIRFAWKLVQSRRVQSQEILHSTFVRVFSDSVSSDSSFVIRHNGREDISSLVRNGGSLRQSLIVIVTAVPINSIVKSRTRYHSSRNPKYVILCYTGGSQGSDDKEYHLLGCEVV
jgi:hypothetical protein